MFVLRSFWKAIIYLLGFIYILFGTLQYFFGIADMFQKIGQILGAGLALH